MLPANLAKTRAAGRTAYGEYIPGPSTATTVGAPPASLRYAPYPLPASVTGQQSHHHQQHHQTAHIIPIGTAPTPSIFQYTTPQQTLYDAAALLSYKRLLAATAAASLRSHPHQHPAAPHTATSAPRATATLSYPLSELLSLQGIDVPALYGLPTLGL